MNALATLRESTNPPVHEPHGPGTGIKLATIGKLNPTIKALLSDYLWNEFFCTQHNSLYPTERKEEYQKICHILQSHTVLDILHILDDYHVSEWMGTNENREYLLKKFEKYMG